MTALRCILILLVLAAAASGQEMPVTMRPVPTPANYVPTGQPQTLGQLNYSYYWTPVQPNVIYVPVRRPCWIGDFLFGPIWIPCQPPQQQCPQAAPPATSPTQ